MADEVLTKLDPANRAESALVLGPYTDVLRTSGAVAFSGSALVARLPMSMFSLGIVFAVEASTGRYGQAGIVSAAALIGQAIGAPLLARLADRWGQSRMLLPVLAANAVGFVAFIALLETATIPVLAALALFVGLTLPSFGALVRARWARLHTGTPRLQTAYALESVLDELVFVIGPPLVTILSTAVESRSGLVLCGALTVVGGGAYATLRRTDPGPRRSDEAGDERRGAQRFPLRTLAWIVVVFVFMGGLFGSVEVVTVAFTEHTGNPGAAGVVLAFFALGSMLAGLAAGSVRWRIGPRRRFVVGQIILALAVAPLPFVGTEFLLGVVVFVAGFAIAPTLIAGFSLVESEVPAPRLTEGLAWVGTALNAGVAAGAAVSGRIIDGPGPSAAYGVTVASGLGAAAVCALAVVIGRRRRNANAPLAESPPGRDTHA